MNKILTDYIDCMRKRMITDAVGGIDAAAAIATANWKLVTQTRSRTVIRNTPALREALIQNGFDLPITDATLRHYLKSQD